MAPAPFTGEVGRYLFEIALNPWIEAERPTGLYAFRLCPHGVMALLLFEGAELPFPGKVDTRKGVDYPLLGLHIDGLSVLGWMNVVLKAPDKAEKRLQHGLLRPQLALNLLSRQAGHVRCVCFDDVRVQVFQQLMGLPALVHRVLNPAHMIGLWIYERPIRRGSPRTHTGTTVDWRKISLRFAVYT